MMTNAIFKWIEILIGFSSGLLVGGAYVAILIVLGVIQRMVQLIRFRRFISYLISALILGVLTGTFFSFSPYTTNYFKIVLIFWGLFHGIFNGMLAAALVEVLNVFPLLSRRLHLENYLLVLLSSLVLGKIMGSLFQWLYFMK